MSPYATRKELADFYKVHIRTIDDWHKFGIRGVRLRREMVGRLVRYRWADVRAFLTAVEARGSKVK